MSKTLRQMAGIVAPRTVDPGKTAVLLVDFQKEYYGGALPIPDGEPLPARALHRASLTALSDRFADILDKDAVTHLGVQARG